MGLYTQETSGHKTETTIREHSLKNAQKLLKVFIYVGYYFQLYFKYEIYNIF